MRTATDVRKMAVMRKKRGPGRPRKFDKSETLDKAVDVFWELGYESADMRTLCDRLGLSKPSIYNSFGSKEDLFITSLQRYLETVSAAHIKCLINADTPQEGFLAYFLSVAKCVTGQHHPSGCLMACVAMPASERVPKVGQFVNETMNSGERWMTNYLKKEKKKGNLPETFKISEAVRLQNDLVIAMGIQGRLGASYQELKRTAKRNAVLVLEGNLTGDSLS